MANSFLEEKEYVIYMFVFVSFFLRGECKILCFASFVSQQRNIVQLQNCIKRNIITQQHADWYMPVLIVAGLLN